MGKTLLRSIRLRPEQVRAIEEAIEILNASQTPTPLMERKREKWTVNTLIAHAAVKRAKKIIKRSKKGLGRIP